MEIIKEGDISRLKHTRRFECDDCGCIFKADNTEYVCCGSQYNISYYKCDCPTCGKAVLYWES